ncbi:MAG: hypothetical protein II456_02010, partial [Firmicutes bacterium]|nr:hypothetical protein [Bacillota bacterium]
MASSLNTLDTISAGIAEVKHFQQVFASFLESPERAEPAVRHALSNSCARFARNAVLELACLRRLRPNYILFQIVAPTGSHQRGDELHEAAHE